MASFFRDLFSALVPWSVGCAFACVCLSSKKVKMMYQSRDMSSGIASSGLVIIVSQAMDKDMKKKKKKASLSCSWCLRVDAKLNEMKKKIWKGKGIAPRKKRRNQPTLCWRRSPHVYYYIIFFIWNKQKMGKTRWWKGRRETTNKEEEMSRLRMVVDRGTVR